MRKLFCLASLALVGCCCICARAGAGPAVFQIGVADGDYGEFAIAGKWEAYAKQFPHDVDFVVGRSDAKEDWSYVQPGPEDEWAGSKPHVFKIHFQMPEPASGYYQLDIDFVSTHPSSPPRLVIGVNGEVIEQKLPAGSSDDALTNPKAGKNCSIHQLLPAAFLRAGDNTISLTDAAGSWLIYDDVRLESGAPAPKEPLTLKARPLTFYKRTPDGAQRAVKLVVENLEGGAVPAELAWTSKAGSGSQKVDLRFGHNDFLITVPDVDQVELALRTARDEIKRPLKLPPAKKWRVYIVPTAHTDIGYTDLQERVRVRHADNGMEALELLEKYPNFKWYSETFWQLNAMLELHPEKTDAVFEQLRQKRWGLSGDYANMLTGLCSSEALNRLTLDSRNLARRGGFELNSVILDDVPSAVGALPMVLAHSGIKYFIEGENNERAPYSGNVPNPFYWEAVDGSRVLCEIVRGYGQAMGLLPGVQEATDRLPSFLAQFDTANNPCDAVLINGAFSDNRQIEPGLAETVKQWNTQWEYPKLIFALPADFFGYVEKNFSNTIPVLKTDFGGWWEDGAGSTALETALSRRAEERAATAEMLHSLAGIMAGAAYPKTNFDALWHNVLLYNEHTWGAAGSISQPDSEQTVKQWEVKASFAHEADAQSRALLDSGMGKLAAMTPASDLVVFNQLAWPRRALVSTATKIAAVRDVASKKISLCQPLPEGGSCFVAKDLPAIGYSSFSADVPLNQPVEDAAQISGNSMENEFYRVVLNPKTGGIQSIYDKQLGRELVDAQGEYDLGEMIYVTGGEGTYAISSNLKGLPPPKFEYHRQTGVSIRQSVGPVFGELVSEATADDFPKITMRVRLYRGLKQLDLICELDKTETLKKEAVYLAFPFALDASQGGLWLEYPDEITEPLKDQHSSACRDWYSVQRWLAVSDGASTVELSPLDAPLFTLGQMTASTWPRELHLNRGHVFAYIMNNYWYTNYKARQGGHFVFRYSLTSSAGPFSKRDAVVKGWNMFCPAAAAQGQGKHRSLLSAAVKSLLGIEPVGLPLTTIKEAEDNDGFVFRCCDYSGDAGIAKLKLPASAREILSCNLVETDAHDLKVHGKSVSIPVKPFEPVTLKARFGR